jgi:hypothetical protein
MPLENALDDTALSHHQLESSREGEVLDQLQRESSTILTQ